MPPRPHARRKPASPSAQLASSASAILERHLASLYSDVGKDLFDRYIDELVDQRTSTLLATSPSFALSRFAKPPARARERIDFLTQSVRKVSPSGIQIRDALKLLAEGLNTKITRAALTEFLRRYAAYHELVLLRGNLRFRSEAIVQMLAEEHRVKQAKVLQMQKEEGGG